MPIERVSWKERLATPAGTLILGLGLAGVLVVCPVHWTAGLRGGVASLLRPGQKAAVRLREEGSRVAGQVSELSDAASRLAEMRRDNQRLQEENRRLAARLADLESRPPSARLVGVEEDAEERLLRARGVRATVLGHAARSYLAENHLLDVGSKQGIRPDALVVETLPGLIDQGENRHLDVEQLVLSQGRVWGKVLEVGPQTSLVRRVTEPGYRDLVRLATPAVEGGPSRFGAQGIVEGTGEPLARIRLVDVTEPVAVGDLVYTSASKGLLPEPLLVGRVVRLERPVGAGQWEIWMEPAVAKDEPETVVVVRAEVNPVRVGEMTNDESQMTKEARRTKHE